MTLQYAEAPTPLSTEFHGMFFFLYLFFLTHWLTNVLVLFSQLQGLFLCQGRTEQSSAFRKHLASLT
uniref:Uncharacterized protein n=1 Tax=Anguilla anguilla TaxID=7936 RepID=A0A0E9VHN9_ANGAN